MSRASLPRPAAPGGVGWRASSSPPDIRRKADERHSCSAGRAPDKMMAGAARPSAAARWARSALSAGRVPVDARGVRSKHVDDREKPRPRRCRW
jgi:hypothetical protein